MPDSPTYRLIYRSHNRIPAAHRRAELGTIFSAARSKNKQLGVTGALLTSDDWFVQALEGDEAVVRDLYAHIQKDVRHEHVDEIEAGLVEARVFSRWAMARISDDGEHDIPLLNNATKGGIVPAAPRTNTPEQEQVLAFMHRTITENSPAGQS